MDMKVMLYDDVDANLGLYSAESMDTFWKRFCGLMGRPEQPVGDAAVFDRCSSIHMFFMRFPIDVIWFGVPSGNVYPVLGVSRDVAPWRVAFGPKGTKGCIEVAAGGVPQHLAKVVLDRTEIAGAPDSDTGSDYRSLVRDRIQITRAESAPHFGGAAHVLVR